MENKKHSQIWTDDDDDDDDSCDESSFSYSSFSTSTDSELNDSKYEKNFQKNKKKFKNNYAYSNKEPHIKKKKFVSEKSETKVEESSEDETDMFAKDLIKTNKKSFVFNIKLEKSDLDKSNHSNDEFSKQETKNSSNNFNKTALTNSASSCETNVGKSWDMYNLKNKNNALFPPSHFESTFDKKNSFSFQQFNSPSNFNMSIDNYTNYQLPPLPLENEPVKPPEPTFDSKRLSNEKIIELFLSRDINKETLRSFFDGDNLNDYSSPIPSPDELKEIVKKSDNLPAKKNSEHKSASRSSSDTSGSDTHSTYSDKSRHSSWSSDRSHSYFSSTSSDESDQSYSTSGSDISRPCRHYRPSKKRRRYSRSYSRSRSYSYSSRSSYHSE